LSLVLHAPLAFNLSALPLVREMIRRSSDKTEFICFGSAVQLQRLQTTGVSINVYGVDNKSVDFVRDLDVHLDSSPHTYPLQQDRLDLLYSSKTTVSSAPINRYKKS